MIDPKLFLVIRFWFPVAGAPEFSAQVGPIAQTPQLRNQRDRPHNPNHDRFAPVIGVSVSVLGLTVFCKGYFDCNNFVTCLHGLVESPLDGPLAI